MFLHGESWGNTHLCAFFFFTVLGALAGVPGLAYRAPGLIFKCVKAWDSNLVHPAKVILLVGNLV